MLREVVHTLQFVWSRTVWVITFGYFIMAVAVIGLLIAAIAQGAVAAGVIGLVVALPILIAIALYCEGYSPQRLELSASQITVLRRYNSITIPNHATSCCDQSVGQWSYPHHTKWYILYIGWKHCVRALTILLMSIEMKNNKETGYVVSFFCFSLLLFG